MKGECVLIYSDMKYRVKGYPWLWALTETDGTYGLLSCRSRDDNGQEYPSLVVRLDQPTYNQLYTIKGRITQIPTVLDVVAETYGSLQTTLLALDKLNIPEDYTLTLRFEDPPAGQNPAEIPGCDVCPKKNLCSGAACYYEDHPEKMPNRELLEDKAQLDASIKLGAPNIRWNKD